MGQHLLRRTQLLPRKHNVFSLLLPCNHNLTLSQVL